MIRKNKKKKRSGNTILYLFLVKINILLIHSHIINVGNKHIYFRFPPIGSLFVII